MIDPLDPPHCVYALYDGDRLLYIGCSRVPDVRLRIHRTPKNFGRSVTMKIIRWYSGIRQATRYEQYYIEKLQPPHNKRLNNRMSSREARKIWRNRHYTMKQALALMPGWKEFMARTMLGKRP